MNISALIQSVRLPFLILTPVCVLLGVSPVIASSLELDLTMFSLVLAGALLAHISVNTFNEYFDFKSGLDLMTIKTPFSGGSGALPDNPQMVTGVLMVAITSMAATLLIGLWLLWQVGSELLPIGIAGILLIFSYTRWINRHPLLCLIAPGFGFGFLMVIGSQFVMVGEYWMLSSLIAVIPFCLINNLLLLNQYPDIEADLSVGRNHFPIAFGVNCSNLVYGCFALLVVVLIVIYILSGYLPVFSLIALIPMPLAVFCLAGAIKHKAGIGSFPQYLAANVFVAISVPSLLAVSIIYGK